MGELNPCPFCGGEAEFERRGDRRQSTIVMCLDCGASLENGETFNHGASWNTRADDARISELEAERDRLRISLATSEVENSDLRAANDVAEMDAGLGTGNLWRFWNGRALDAAARNTALEAENARLRDALARRCPMTDAPSMTPDQVLAAQLAAADLLNAHKLCSAIPPNERTPLENDVAQMGRNRLQRIAGRTP